MFLQMGENAHFTLIFEVLCYGLVLAQDIFTVDFYCRYDYYTLQYLKVFLHAIHFIF